ncbi:MAG: phosphatase PAP2 family protein [Ignavibacteria bacterium]|nr:phosphatase PAP2 family protein [Ignavibacteria bacterium]
MEILQSIDADLFHFINGTLSNPFTDKFMPFITERNHWFIFYGLIWLYLVFKGGKRGRVSAVLILMLILLADQTSENIFKQYFQRIRPCNALENVHLLINCSGSYSFPSNHAVNNFAAATLFSCFYPRMKTFLFTGAFIIALSRVMCGVHYPFDIAAGAMFGILFGMIIIYLWKIFNKRFKILT